MMTSLRRIRRALSWRNDGDDVPPERFLLEFNRSLSTVQDEEPLRMLIAARMAEWLKVDRLLLYTRDMPSQRFVAVAGQGFDSGPPQVVGSQALSWAPELASDSRLAQWIERNDEPLHFSDHPGFESDFSSDERALVLEHGFEGCLPLSSLHSLHGFVLTGSSPGRDPRQRAAPPWTPILLTQTGLALEHASLVSRQRSRIRQMYWADRLAIAGQLAAGAAHEIRNPLTTVRSTIQHVGERIESEPLRESLSGVLVEVDRVDRILNDLLSFSRPSTERSEDFDLELELSKVLELLTAQSRRSHVDVTLRGDGSEHVVYGDRTKIRQLFLNLAMNALQAMPEGGRLDVRVSGRMDDLVRIAVVEFADTGAGIAADALDQCFGPRTGSGTAWRFSVQLMRCAPGTARVSSPRK